MSSLYVLFFCVAFVFLVTVSLTIWYQLVKYFDGFRTKSRFARFVCIALFYISVLCSVFLSLGIVICLGDSVAEESSNVSLESDDVQYVEITLQGQELLGRLESLDKLTSQEIRNTLSEALAFSNNLKPIIEEQAKKIEDLRSRVETERDLVANVKQLAAETQAITETQLSVVKRILTKDANSTSQYWFFVGIVVSFPVGVSTSFLGSWLFRHLPFRSADH